MAKVCNHLRATATITTKLFEISSAIFFFILRVSENMPSFPEREQSGHQSLFLLVHCGIFLGIKRCSELEGPCN